MKKNYNFNKKSMPKAYNRTGESLLEVICNYLFITLLLVLLGLLVSGDSGRGLPVPWLSNGHVDGSRLLLSFLMFGAVVIVAGIFARIHKAGETDYTSQYRSANVIANNSSNVLINDMDDFGRAEASEVRTSVRSLPKSSTKKSKSIEVPMLNGERPSKNTSRKGKKSSVGSIIALLVALTMLAPIMTMCDEIFNDDSDDGWFIEETDDTDSEDVDFDDNIRYVATSSFQDNLMNKDEEWLASVGTGDTSAFYSFIDWDSVDDNETILILESVSDDYTFAVVKYKITLMDGSEHFIAMKLKTEDGSDVDLADKDEIKVVGITVTSGVSSYLDDVYNLNKDFYSDDVYKQISDVIKNNSVNIGDTMVDSTPIMEWE